ncbi:MAG: hypothetical protein V1766_06830 [Pseudomonadota bacterium]
MKKRFFRRVFEFPVTRTLIPTLGPTTPDDIKGLPKAFLDIVNLAVSKKTSFVLHAGDIFHARWDHLDTLYSNFKLATENLNIS